MPFHQTLSMGTPTLASNFNLLRKSVISDSPIYFEFHSKDIDSDDNDLIIFQVALDGLEPLILEKLQTLGLSRFGDKVNFDILSQEDSAPVLQNQSLTLSNGQIVRDTQVVNERWIYAFAKSIFIDKLKSYTINLYSHSKPTPRTNIVAPISYPQHQRSFQTMSAPTPSIKKVVDIKPKQPSIDCDFYFQLLPTCDLFEAALSEVFTKKGMKPYDANATIDTKRSLLFTAHFASSLRHGADSLNANEMAKKMGGNCIWVLLHHSSDDPKRGDVPSVRSGMFLYDKDRMYKTTIYVPLQQDWISELKQAKAPKEVENPLTTQLESAKSLFKDKCKTSNSV